MRHQAWWDARAEFIEQAANTTFEWVPDPWMRRLYAAKQWDSVGKRAL